MIALLKFVNGKLKDSEPYQFAMAAAQRDETVAAALGSPLTAGSVTSGSFNQSNFRSSYNMAVPISGPKGKGTLRIVASKVATDADWTYDTLDVVVSSTKATIELSKKAPPPK